MTIDVIAWEAQLLLEALRTLEAQWDAVIENTEDEDIQSDYGNDLAQLQLLLERIEPQLTGEFGSGIARFSRKPLGVTPKEQ